MTSYSNRQYTFRIPTLGTNMTTALQIAQTLSISGAAASASNGYDRGRSGLQLTCENPKLTPLEYRNLQKRPGETRKAYKQRVKAFMNNFNRK